MFTRKAMASLKRWKQYKTTQALLVDGARQVGKTTLIEQFAHDNYDHVVEINLYENDEAREALSSATNSKDLFLRISAFAGTTMVPGKTLIFLDEVQECPQIVTMIKFLMQRNDYDYILSGSMLGVELKNIRSQPVGYLMTTTMYPMDFEEFAWANGIGTDVIDTACEAFNTRTPVDEFIHRRLLQLFHQYLICGGMPDAVHTFIETNDIQRTRAVQEGIVDLYRQDISKYAGNRARIVRRIFDLIPAELNDQNKRFVIRDVEGQSRINRYDNDFMWLSDANVALPTYNVSEPRYPLAMSMTSTKFKLFMADTGLLTYACGMDVVRDILIGRSDINYGSIYENVVAQELKAHNNPLYYYKSRTIGELDFLVEHNNVIVPIEVKSGKDYKRHSALNNALRTDNWHINEAIVFYDGNVGQEGKLLYLPIYMVGCLQGKQRAI